MLKINNINKFIKINKFYTDYTKIQYACNKNIECNITTEQC